MGCSIATLRAIRPVPKVVFLMTTPLDRMIIALAGRLDHLSVNASSMPQVDRMTLTTRLRSLESKVTKAIRDLEGAKR